MRDLVLSAACAIAFAAAVGHLGGMLYAFVSSAVSLSTFGAEAARDVLVPSLTTGIIAVGLPALALTLPLCSRRANAVKM